MACLHKSYKETDLEDRRKVVADAISSQRLEGLELDSETHADFESFSDGSVDLTEVRARIEARFTSVEPSTSFEI